MKIIICCILLTVSSITFSFSTTHTVINSGFTFSPSNLAINLGDTVSFILESSHNAVEVSQTTWNANGNTSNSGFSTPFGGGKVIPTVVGTYYYVCSPHASFGMKGTITVNPTTEIKGSKKYKPSSFILYQNYPNPFNPTTRISYALHVALKIFNILGQVIATLVDDFEQAGYKSVEWNADGLPSGTYFYRLHAGNFSHSKKLLLMR